MRKLFIILVSFLAIVTFLRAIDNSENTKLSIPGAREASIDTSLGEL